MAMTAKTLTAANGKEIGFLEYIPAKVDGLFIFLHGQGERRPGTSVAEINVVATNGTPKIINEGKFPYNAIVLCPQLNSQYSTWQLFYIDEMLNYAKNKLGYTGKIKMLTGLSLGGGGVWNYACNGQYKSEFTLYAPVCATDEFDTSKLCAIPAFWAFHSMDDSTVPVGNTQKAESWVYTCQSPNKRFTYFASGNHNGAWEKAYDPGHPTFQLAGGKTLAYSPNLYERGLEIPSTSLPPAEPNKNIMTVKLNAVLTGNVWTSDPAGTIGVVSWDYKLVDSATGVYYKPDWDGPTNGNSNPDKLPTASNIKPGKWTAVLTTEPGKVATRLPFEVLASGTVTPPPPVVNKTALGILFDAGNAITVYKDSSAPSGYSLNSAKSL